MKVKPKILTILLILLLLYLVLETFLYYRDKQVTWDKCVILSDEIVVVEPNNTETWEGWQNWTECNERFTNQFMMFEVMRILSVITLLSIILSWKVDVLYQT